MGEATAAAENLSEAVKFTFQRAEAEQGWEMEAQASHCTLSQKRDSRTHSALLILVSFPFTSAVYSQEGGLTACCAVMADD